VAHRPIPAEGIRKKRQLTVNGTAGGPITLPWRNSWKPNKGYILNFSFTSFVNQWYRLCWEVLPENSLDYQLQFSRTENFWRKIKGLTEPWSDGTIQIPRNAKNREESNPHHVMNQIPLRTNTLNRERDSRTTRLVRLSLFIRSRAPQTLALTSASSAAALCHSCVSAGRAPCGAPSPKR